MTNEEALEHFKLHDYWCAYSWQDEAAIVAIEAIEKQIPKKPNYYKKFAIDTDIGMCPSCGDWMNSEMKHCDKCGQAIDWNLSENPTYCGGDSHATD